LTLIALPWIAISELKTALTDLPFGVCFDLFAILTIILSQIKVAEGALREPEHYSLELSPHELFTALRMGREDQNIQDIARGNASTSLFIPAPLVFTPQIDGSAVRCGCMRSLSRCFKPIEKTLRLLHSELEKSCAQAYQTSLAPSGVPVPLLSSLCASMIRSERSVSYPLTLWSLGSSKQISLACLTD
jgi:hypothetical protein